jgi:DNA-binding NarL/FixJ family response regulator
MNKNPQTIRLLIVDDHQMVRDGIRVMLSLHNKDYIFIISEAENGEDAIKKVLHNKFDIVLMDYQLPKMTGVEAVEQILLYRPHVKILVLSNYDEVTYISSMLVAGATGYVLKNIEPYQLLMAIKTVLNNTPYYSNEIALKLIENEKAKPSILDVSGLTKREIVVLKMITQEMSNEEIGKSLNLAKRTIDSHRQNLLNKLNVKNTAGLVKAAYRLKII